jgi:hypothetical protein
VEASRNQPRDDRQKFIFLNTLHSTEITGLDNYPPVPSGDIEVLQREGLIHVSYGLNRATGFDVSPLGFRYYEYLMQERGAPTERIEERVTSYLDSADFEKRHPEVYVKWQQAEGLLWDSDSQQQHTAIGHHCREAMQYFATSLVKQFQPPDVEQDPALTIKRLADVLQHASDQMSDSVTEILKALLNYWAKLNDLAQRQEHGAQKEGAALIWEDSRRLVFQTAIVMFEIDRTLQDLK